MNKIERIELSKESPFCKETIYLTGSKSESNRALIIQAISQGKICIHNLSEAADTKSLKDILLFLKGRRSGHVKALNPGMEASEPICLDIGPAGTSMRFLTAYAAANGISAIITGSARMRERPIGLLVEALRTLGAHITYLERDGYPPLFLDGTFKQKTSKISLQADVSSQFLTALLLIAPALPMGLELSIVGSLTSKPYVEMTLGMLSLTGVKHRWIGNTIVIAPQVFSDAHIDVEPDWSAASYWYAIVALCAEATIHLPGLKKHSLQGDSQIFNIMDNFGVSSTFNETGVTLSKIDKKPSLLYFNFTNCPDIAQTIIVCCAALGHNAQFGGLHTLKIKETDRIKALQLELAKLGAKFYEDEPNRYVLDCGAIRFPTKIQIHTYEDHRMAMAFAPLALRIPKVEIENPQVVHKSYPNFWEDLKKIGYTLK